MSQYYEVDTIKDEEIGLVAVITARDKPNGFKAFSFAVFKEFERSAGSPTQRTSYLSRRHIPAAHHLIDRVEDRIREEEERMHAKRRKQGAAK